MPAVEDAAAHLYVWALKDIPQDLRDALADLLVGQRLGVDPVDLDRAAVLEAGMPERLGDREALHATMRKADPFDNQPSREA